MLGEPARWGRRPPEIEHELRVWLAMPGFHPTYHAHVLGLSLYSIRKHIGGYEEMAEEVAENWLSATRDDCVRFVPVTPPQRFSASPVPATGRPGPQEAEGGGRREGLPHHGPVAAELEQAWFQLSGLSAVGFCDVGVLVE